MISQQPFGRTGHMSTQVIFGGAALWVAPQAEADRVLDLLLEYGINHIDTAPSYGDAELRIGPWMDRHRKQFFLATKTLERTYQGARDEIQRSLERLHTDQIDLLQLHYLVKPEVGGGAGAGRRVRSPRRGWAGLDPLYQRYPGVLVKLPPSADLERFDFDWCCCPTATS